MWKVKKQRLFEAQVAKTQSLKDGFQKDGKDE